MKTIISNNDLIVVADGRSHVLDPIVFKKTSMYYFWAILRPKPNTQLIKKQICLLNFLFFFFFSRFFNVIGRCFLYVYSTGHGSEEDREGQFDKYQFANNFQMLFFTEFVHKYQFANNLQSKRCEFRTPPKMGRRPPFAAAQTQTTPLARVCLKSWLCHCTRARGACICSFYLINLIYISFGVILKL